MSKKFARQRGRIFTESPAFYHINLVIGGSFMLEPIEQTITLSNREQRVLQWATWGVTNDAIAEELHIALGTVKFHFEHIFDKLGVPRRTQENPRGTWKVNRRARAIYIALQLGLVDLNNSPF